MVVLDVFFLVTTAVGAFYLANAAIALVKFARRPIPLVREFLPTIAVLKPIAGDEPGLYANLASFCDQDYNGLYEVVFCLHSDGDSARRVVERVAAEFPAARPSIVYGENPDLINPKIANLAKDGVTTCRDVVVIADSDVRVGRDYLRALAAAFESQSVGAVTCLYSATPNRHVVSRLGALGINDGFAPSVLVALALGELRFCLGATMAVRGSVLATIGGLSALGRTLADDHLLGTLVNGAGYRVELSRYVVSTMVPETKLSALWAHELRWARTDFEVARGGYLFSFVIYALPLALVYLAVSRNVLLGLPLLALVLALRVSVHYLARRTLGASGPDDVALVLPRDFMTLGVWAASLFGRRKSFR
ncbi:MAG TPA: bacteriohopanetetrol glucosamine biosynthesis glycosyltransferase HpnI [Candidatus Cybelea sp.]|jgi:ceramide glucosyltransferase|nr:bacteriohopanetetrol glucosamine biosynthesis glycosyltransferase HpnI [Candidatus Cybelea sp.]